MKRMSAWYTSNIRTSQSSYSTHITLSIRSYKNIGADSAYRILLPWCEFMQEHILLPENWVEFMQEHILLPENWVEFMQEHKLAIVNIWTQAVHMLVSNKSDWHSQIKFSACVHF